MKRLTVWTLVALMLAPTLTIAQSRNAEGLTLGPIARAALKANTSGETLVALGSIASLQAQGQQKWRTRHPVLHNVLWMGAVGAGIGATLGALVSDGDEDAVPPRHAERIQGAVFGAILLGEVFGAVGWACTKMGCF